MQSRWIASAWGEMDSGSTQKSAIWLGILTVKQCAAYLKASSSSLSDLVFDETVFVDVDATDPDFDSTEEQAQVGKGGGGLSQGQRLGPGQGLSQGQDRAVAGVGDSGVTHNLARKVRGGLRLRSMTENSDDLGATDTVGDAAEVLHT